ncbi:MAG: leucine-rich repeat domain-containing protein [Saccharofermentans sp.]|nr:leucine-rich repeat domain-containing protein [Saccharofermentans sp.]
MRKLLSVVLILSFLFVFASCSHKKDYFYLSEDGNYCPNLEDYTIDELKELVTGEFIVPEGAQAFYRLEGFTKITKVVVPSSVTYLPVHAFDGCTALTEVVLPDTLTAIKGHTFEDCPNLKSLVLPKSFQTMIGPNNFFRCGITEYYFPAEVELVNYTRDKIFTQMPQEASAGEHNITVYVVEGSWMDIHFDDLYRDENSIITNNGVNECVPAKAYWNGYLI